MQQVPVRELNQHTAEVLARVERGEQLEITRNGLPVAIISPSVPNPLSALIESGDLLQAPTGRIPWFDDSEVFATDEAGLEAVLEDRRAEGRW